MARKQKTFNSLASFKTALVTRLCYICDEWSEDVTDAMITLRSGGQKGARVCRKHEPGCKRQGVEIVAILRDGIKLVEIPDGRGGVLLIPTEAQA